MPQPKTKIDQADYNLLNLLTGGESLNLRRLVTRFVRHYVRPRMTAATTSILTPLVSRGLVVLDDEGYRLTTNGQQAVDDFPTERY